MAIQKYNYIDTIQPLVPSLYLDREDLNYGVEEELTYKVLARYLKLIESASSVFFHVSGMTLEELQARFVPANKLTRVTPDVVNDYVFAPLGKDLTDYTASSDFEDFLTGSALSAVILNGDYDGANENKAFRLLFSGDAGVIPGLSSLYPEVSTVSLAHDKLVEKLGLLYFLNSSGPGFGFTTVPKSATHSNLSSLASSLWVEKIFKGKTVTEEDCLHTLAEFIWKNRDSGYPELKADAYIPEAYLSSTSQVSGETYLSGTQQLDAYKTALSLWVNANMDTSPIIKDSLDVFVSSTLVPTKFANSGSLFKFLRALGFASYDLNHVVDSLSD